jgi:indole-3-glycerol phosphate synthase
LNNILLEIAAHKKKEVKLLEKSLPVEDVIKHISSGDILDFKAAISDDKRINIIAEIKKASPSKGVMNHNFDPAELAGKYQEGGAVALSVLADEKYFQGSPKYIEIAKKCAKIPVLYKEFIVSSYQIYYARLMKADAVLLIVKLLNKEKLKDLLQQTNATGMVALVEVHDEEETRIAVDSGAEIIGVNNRNLEDFSVSLEISEKLIAQIPGHVIKVAESGISSASQIRQLKQAGYDGFLVGEALVKSMNPVDLLRSLQAV